MVPGPEVGTCGTETDLGMCVQSAGNQPPLLVTLSLTCVLDMQTEMLMRQQNAV